MSTETRDEKIEAAAKRYSVFLQTGGQHVTKGMRSAQAAYYAKKEGLIVGKNNDDVKDPIVASVQRLADQLMRR